jgi:hypothetical protein
VIDWDGDALSSWNELQIGADIFSSDTDGDGLSDGQEVREYLTGPLVADTDGDGLSDRQEVWEYLTGPLVADTDGDGLSDGQEVWEYLTGPLLADTDGDGLSDGQEVREYLTGPLVADTDGDGLSDGQEVREYLTGPLVADTDNDQMTDGEEVLGSWHIFELESAVWDNYFYRWYLKHEIRDNAADNYLESWSWLGRSWTWPYDYENILTRAVLVTSNPLSPDTDADGLDDKEEHEIGTDPRSGDTDNDNISDLMEVMVHETIPLFYDTDGDLLGDGEELNVHSTDPLDWDNDDDHLSDGMEIRGYDIDGDNIIDVDFPAYGANPLVRDIFVEIDWMPEARKLGDYAKGKLVEAFAEHNIILHLDQGELGGGSQTEEGADILYDNKEGPMNDFYDFRKKYFTPSRAGVYYWCLMTSGPAYLGEKEVGGFSVGVGFVVVAEIWMRDGTVGSAFMHELGHGLGLNSDDFDGIDSDKYSFNQYRSVMNYNSPHEFFDYSGGAPFNDWEHIDFEWLYGRHYQI